MDETKTLATAPLSAVPRPFLRWAGSKRAFIGTLTALLPRTYGTYWEPFAGSASLFFALKPEKAVISDSCIELMRTYEAVRDNVGAVSRHLRPLKPTKELFYEVRRVRSRGRFRSAAHFIYLNKTGWNGLYRVNSRGEYNVPYGRPKTEHITDFNNLYACSRLLRRPGVTIRSGDFETVLGNVEPTDLVFLDPPYVTRHNNNGFIDYNNKLFSWNDQKRLARVAMDLANAGAAVVVTNAAHREVLQLYPGFNSAFLDRWSTLAGDSSKRGIVREAILYKNVEALG